jgi:hypothetical protein
MKKILLLILLFPCLLYSQNKYIKPMVIFDIPIQKAMMNGLSMHVGALFGDQKFIQIGLLMGYRSDQTSKNTYDPVIQTFTYSLLWRVPIKKFTVIPMFSYANKKYQDVSIRLGHSFDKENMSFIHIFASTQLGYGVGTTILLK